MADIIKNPGDNAEMLKPYEVELKAPAQAEKQEQAPSQTQQPQQPETTGVKQPPIDRDKVVGIAEESKTQMAVNNDGSTNEATKNVKEPLQRGQTAPKDENQQRQQRKPKGPKP